MATREVRPRVTSGLPNKLKAQEGKQNGGLGFISSYTGFAGNLVRLSTVEQLSPRVLRILGCNQQPTCILWGLAQGIQFPSKKIYCQLVFCNSFYFISRIYQQSWYLEFEAK